MSATLSALRFQPIRRPQINQKKPAKPGFPKAIPPSSNNSTAASPPNETRDPTTNNSSTAPPPASSTPPPGYAPARTTTTLADWAATNNDDDEYLWGAGAGEKRQRGGRRAKKKKQQQLAANRETDWDEIYDPAHPTNVDEYLRSDERIREVQEWKAVLYTHRRRRRGSYGDEDDSEEDSEVEGRTGLGSKYLGWLHVYVVGFLANSDIPTDQFAPPADYSFAPPPMSPPPGTSAPNRDSPTTSAAAPIPDDATGDDAYARRLAMSGMGGAAVPPPPPAAAEEGATISRGPVRYEAPPQPPAPQPPNDDTMDLDAEDDEVNVDNIIIAPSTNPDDANNEGGSSTKRPGQAGFAQRLMSKYGWTAGSGLGASSSGIINPLQVKLEKRRRRPDVEGGGFADPNNRAKIIAPKTSSSTNPSSSTASGNHNNSDNKFGPMSQVILLANMLHNMPDLQSEIADGLGQEIGQECGDKYGRVERLYIDIEGRQVFIKFTDAVSALRAVNALEGRVFNGNVIAARFWDAEKFERGEYT